MSRPRIALIPSEAIRPKMAGIGIRYLELARRLPALGVDVTLVTAGPVDEVPRERLDPTGTDVVGFERGRLGELTAGCGVVLAQGQLANDAVLEIGDRPVAIDLYDPFLVENLAYVETLGLDPWRNDHATWVLQLSRGDFFLCSSEAQRRYYLGFLTALGRVNPYRIGDDPDLRRLIDIVPFGVPDELPPHRPYLDPPTAPETRRLLFGGLYDWYDPWPVLEAVTAHPDEPWELLFIHNPNSGTPQALFHQVEAWCRKRGLWDVRVRALDWVPGARRFDLLRDVDLVVSTHRASLETRLSLRTRFLEALAAGCPVVTTEGGAVSRLLIEYDAGWVVPEADASAVATALRQALRDEVSAGRRRAGARRLVEGFAWDQVLAPLVAFCRNPVIDPTKDAFAFRPETTAPPDPFVFRLRRRLRRLFA
ncbi:MAG: glycosyltransferase family 4 protein [Acidobacteriota bacterium]